MPDNEVRLPEFVVPEGQTAGEALAFLSISGAKERGFIDNPKYIERLKNEVSVIDERGFSKYFLTMSSKVLIQFIY